METKENNVELIGYTLIKPVIISFPNEAKLARLNIKMENSEVFNILLINENVGLIDKDLAVGTKFSIKGTLINHTYKNKLGEEKHGVDILTKQLKVLTPPEKIPQE
jgi:hypothetical protein